jgi:adenylate kinase family enzyme
VAARPTWLHLGPVYIEVTDGGVDAAGHLLWAFLAAGYVRIARKFLPGGRRPHTYAKPNWVSRWHASLPVGERDVVGGRRRASNMPMKKVAVFGNAGGSKSTLSTRLAEVTGLPLYMLDIIQFRDGKYRPDEKDGGKLPDEEYVSIRREVLSRDEWIIDGYGSLPTVWERISAADTLVYIDLPLIAHYWGVTKRFAVGLFRNPNGWPGNSPIWESTLDGYRVIRKRPVSP